MRLWGRRSCVIIKSNDGEVQTPVGLLQVIQGLFLTSPGSILRNWHIFLRICNCSMYHQSNMYVCKTVIQLGKKLYLKVIKDLLLYVRIHLGGVRFLSGPWGQKIWWHCASRCFIVTKQIILPIFQAVGRSNLNCIVSWIWEGICRNGILFYGLKRQHVWCRWRGIFICLCIWSNRLCDFIRQWQCGRPPSRLCHGQLQIVRAPSAEGIGKPIDF